MFKKINTKILFFLIAAILSYPAISILVSLTTLTTNGYCGDVTDDLMKKIERAKEGKGDVLFKLDKWYKGGFGNVMIADFTINNLTDNDIKDIKITCTQYAKSGTIIGSNTQIIYDIVKAKQTKKFKKVNMGIIHNQAYETNCKLIDYQ
jgi:hypothetical protein